MAQVKQGECEVCPDKPNVRITLCHNNIWMCDECVAKDSALRQSITDTEKQQKLNEVLERSRQIDQSINVKTDLFNAATVPAVELKAAIDSDESIPADQKHYRYTEECFNRLVHMKKVVFEERQKLLEDENIMRMWQTQVRTSAATLSAELREKFKAEDLNYTPTTPKTVKSPSSKGKKTFDKEAVLEASRKYNIPMAAVQLIVNARHVTPEVSARHQRLTGDGKECGCTICEANAKRVAK